MNISKGLVLFFLLFALQSHAQDSSVQETSQNSEPIYHQYFTITDKNTARPTSFTNFEFSPTQFLQVAQELVVNLLRWTLHNEDRPMPGEAYVRKLHFGRWINDPTDDTCMNTRSKVLVRDSEAEVTYRNERKCVVANGKWLDLYSNQQFLASQEIQIDHMVPLKHAYMAGAWRWDYRTRCLYANYMGYRHHLIPASVHENTSKGDRAPNQYLPPELSYRCQYVKDWLTIKLIWNLTMTADEVQAIYDVVTHYNCSASDFQISQTELEQQRQFIYQNLDFCVSNR